MALKGNDLVSVEEKGNSKVLCDFFDKIIENNKYKEILIVCDNARIHHSKVVKEHIKNKPIKLVYLPPYSPDLNPIEFEWKDSKNKISKYTNFLDRIKNANEIVLKFMKERKFTYSKSWIKEFITIDNYKLILD